MGKTKELELELGEALVRCMGRSGVGTGQWQVIGRWTWFVRGYRSRSGIRVSACWDVGDWGWASEQDLTGYRLARTVWLQLSSTEERSASWTWT